MKPLLTGPLAARKKLFLRARDVYYNDTSGKTLMSDADFDALEDSIREEDPEWKGLKDTGSKIKKQKVKLKYKMASLNKVKPHEVEKWLERHSADRVTVTEKLDGTSLQLVYENGVPIHCYTRGTGDVGGDVSFIIPHLTIPRKIGFKKELVVRCEGLFARTSFQKYKHEFDTPRAAASGIMNRSSDKIHKNATRDMHVVALMVLNPWVAPSKGLAFLAKAGFKIPANKTVPTESVTASKLSTLLAKRRKFSRYQMDGLVLMWDHVNPKPTAEKPDWAVAFKEEQSLDDAAVATVIEVIWQVSAHGILVPKIKINPTMIDDVKVQHATCNNAKWMKDMGIGVGAKIKIVRGGEIIPKVVKVLKPAKFSPPPKSLGEYEWDKNGTHLILSNPKDNETAVVKKIARFFIQLDVEWMAVKTVQRMYDAGLDTISKILRATPKDLMKIEGIQSKGANRIYEEIQKLINGGAFLPKIMAASGAFDRGLGSKRVAAIQKVYPNLLGLAKHYKSELREMLLEVPGFQKATADMFISGIYKFVPWFEKTGIKIAKPEVVKKSSNKLDGLGVSWTGYRSEDEENTVRKAGGEIVLFGGSTDVLLYSPTGKTSSKLGKAKAKGIPTMTWDIFAAKYKL